MSNQLSLSQINTALDASPGPLLLYWPNQKNGGKSLTGHIAILFKSKMYLSHCPGDGAGQKRNTRTDVPGLEGLSIAVKRHDSQRNRELQADLEKYGTPTLQPLSADLNWFYMEQFAKTWLLCSRPAQLIQNGPLHGPLPYYQLCDTVAGEGDRSQCASTVLSCLKEGISLDQQHLHKQIGSPFEPESVYLAAKQYLAG